MDYKGTIKGTIDDGRRVNDCRYCSFSRYVVHKMLQCFYNVFYTKSVQSTEAQLWTSCCQSREQSLEFKKNSMISLRNLKNSFGGPKKNLFKTKLVSMLYNVL